jgi:cytochrome c-type biogenesis protein CcmH
MRIRVPEIAIHAALACGLLAAAAAPAPRAQEAPPEFASAAEQDRYESLLRELRCLVCQNQSLAESNAPLALDLRTEVLNRVRAGMSKDEIVEFLVARYGDFVLYRPPLKRGTWALWFGPFLLLAIGIAVVIRVALSRGGVEPEPRAEAERGRPEGAAGPPDGTARR